MLFGILLGIFRDVSGVWGSLWEASSRPGAPQKHPRDPKSRTRRNVHPQGLPKWCSLELKILIKTQNIVQNIRSTKDTEKSVQIWPARASGRLSSAREPSRHFLTLSWTRAEQVPKSYQNEAWSCPKARLSSVIFQYFFARLPQRLGGRGGGVHPLLRRARWDKSGGQLQD